MKRNKILLFVLLLQWVTVLCAKAQPGTDTALLIGIQPAQILVQEIAVSLEKAYQKHSMGLLLAVRLSTEEDPAVSKFMMNAGKSFTYTSARYNGLTAGLSRKYFLKKSKKPEYLEIQAFYKFWWFNDRFYAYRYDGSSSPDKEFNSSVRLHVLGIKLQWGTRLVSKGHARIGSYCDLYGGIGGRVHFSNEYGSKRDAYDYAPNGYPFTPFSEKKTEWLPSVQAGVNIGILVRKARHESLE